MSHATWNAVTPHLCATRRVIAFDVAGFGMTPPLPPETPPTVVNLVEGLRRSIRAMGIEEPVDIVGISLGGAMALEAARRGIARNVVALAPAGLWKTRGALHVNVVFAGLRFGAKHFPNLLRAAMRRPLLRELALAVPFSVGSRRMPVGDAVRAVDDLAASPGFEATFKNTRAPFSGAEIVSPVTVVFGTRDWILPKGSQCRHGLPAHTVWVKKPGWGHVPMWVDPVGVSQLILDSTQ